MGWLSGWSFRKKITLATSTYLSGNVTADHAILVVRDSADTDFWGEVKANGEDVRFTSADGTTELKYHFELFDHTPDDMVAWVKVVDTFTSGSDTDIFMYYGNAGASDDQDENNTFSFYTNVYHMQQNASNEQADSCVAGETLTHVGFPDYAQAGKIGDSVSYVANSDYSTNANVMNAAATKWSVSFWVKKTDGWHGEIGGEGITPTIWSETNSGTNASAIGIWHDHVGHRGEMSFNVTTNGGIELHIYSSKTTWAANTWFHIVMVWNGDDSTMQLYVDTSTVDGATASSTGQTTWVTGTEAPFNLSIINDASDPSTQFIDEFKFITGVALTSDEVKLIYRSENQDLQSFGAKQSTPTKTFTDDAVLNA